MLTGHSLSTASQSPAPAMRRNTSSFSSASNRASNASPGEAGARPAGTVRRRLASRVRIMVGLSHRALQTSIYLPHLAPRIGKMMHLRFVDFPCDRLNTNSPPLHGPHDGLDRPALPLLPAQGLSGGVSVHRDDHYRRAAARRPRASSRLRSRGASRGAAAGW